jgi:hypothetical protein
MNHHPRIFISWVQKELAAERRALPLENPNKAVTMTTGKTTIIKSLLRDECLPALNQSAAYVSMADVRAWLQLRGVACPPPVLRD